MSEKQSVYPRGDRAWAVVDARGRLEIVDGRLPLFWRRHVAKRFIEERALWESMIRRVEVWKVVK